jgi:hypothetical protein
MEKMHSPTMAACGAPVCAQPYVTAGTMALGANNNIAYDIKVMGGD